MTDDLRLDEVEAMLKDFQRATVDHVAQRFFGENPTDRFLVADEVGLGKTLVARGVIARTIKHHLERDHKRIDIIYICSNADIARQNVSRLNVTGRNDLNIATRITLLPRVLNRLSESRVNFVSFTPGTSFNLRSSEGIVEERAVLYHLLQRIWGPKKVRDSRPDHRVFQGWAQVDTIQRWIRWLDPEQLNDTLVSSFRKTITAHDKQAMADGVPTLRQRYDSVRRGVSYVREQQPSFDVCHERSALIGDLRSLLARSCVRALDPQLVILDEFQRFRHIMHGDSDAAQLARDLFEYEDVRVLLLSATPYKMYTLSSEEGEDHYADFLETMRFLFDDPRALGRFTDDLRNYRRALFHLGRDGDIDAVRHPKRRIEQSLRLHMARTERLAVSADRSGMLREMPVGDLEVTVRDLKAFVDLESVGQALGVGGMLEYWKSTAYPLNFMEGYKVDRELARFLEEGRDRELAAALRGADLLMDLDDVREYREIDPGNARLRALASDVIGRGTWRLLWVPPALPYYRLAGPYAAPEIQGFTKRLIFSSWTVVPKMISTMLTYGAERAQVTSFPDYPQENTPEARRGMPPLLMFTRSDERLTGMPVLALLYPSHALARLGDPRDFALPNDTNSPPSLEDVRAQVRDRIRDHLQPFLDEAPTDGAVDEHWYWAAPFLLDNAQDADAEETWWSQRSLASLWTRGEADDGDQSAPGRWVDHVEEARRFAAGLRGDLSGELGLGRPPRDLIDALTDLAVAGPGVCALRALSRVTDGSDALTDLDVRGRAGFIASGLRSLFNLPETQALIRGLAVESDDADLPYWRHVLRYSADGCLQAVLDEYAHVLPEWEGIVGADRGRVAEVVAVAMREALMLRTASYKVADLRVQNGRLTTGDRRMRGLFALRFGDTRSVDEKSTLRQSHVRKAFNSPFWPFVLATTSIGQEGLDFHLYCHAVVHWNLPSNPVDLEQREGRIHRYKGHAIRKNLASQYASYAMDGQADGWEAMFEEASADRDAGESELVPYWIFADGDARIERYVPSIPLSREEGRLDDLKRSLAAYRLVFGQPRQDDLVAFLRRRMSTDAIAELLDELRIDLTPGGPTVSGDPS